MIEGINDLFFCKNFAIPVFNFNLFIIHMHFLIRAILQSCFLLIIWALQYEEELQTITTTHEIRRLSKKSKQCVHAKTAEETPRPQSTVIHAVVFCVLCE